MKVAVFTPLNPARCGVSDYSEALLAHLTDHVETTVFVDNYQPDRFAGDEKATLRHAAEFDPAEFDETVYHIGNNPYHLYAYDAALDHPGIVVLHEFNLHHLMAAATIARDDWDSYLTEVQYNGGAEARAFAERVRRLEVGPDYEGLAMNRRLLERSKALVVHSPFLRGQVRDAGFELPIAHIPHGAWIPEVNRHQYRAKLGLDESTPLIGVFGFLKPYKRIAESLRAVARLVRIHPEVRMILVGEEHQDFPVRRLISQLDLGPFVRLLGHVDISEFEQCIGAVDICLNLRYPTDGETSGTLLRALGLGRAVVVSDVGSFSDLPDEICLKVPVGQDEVDIIGRYLDLLVTRPEAARAMGAAARDYAARECAWPHVAELYASWIAAVAEGRAEPDRLARSATPEPDEARENLCSRFGGFERRGGAALRSRRSAPRGVSDVPARPHQPFRRRKILSGKPPRPAGQDARVDPARRGVGRCSRNGRLYANHPGTGAPAGVRRSARLLLGRAGQDRSCLGGKPPTGGNSPATLIFSTPRKMPTLTKMSVFRRCFVASCWSISTTTRCT